MGDVNNNRLQGGHTGLKATSTAPNSVGTKQGKPANGVPPQSGLQSPKTPSSLRRSFLLPGPKRDSAPLGPIKEDLKDPKSSGYNGLAPKQSDAKTAPPGEQEAQKKPAVQGPNAPSSDSKQGAVVALNNNQPAPKQGPKMEIGKSNSKDLARQDPKVAPTKTPIVPSILKVGTATTSSSQTAPPATTSVPKDSTKLIAPNDPKSIKSEKSPEKTVKSGVIQEQKGLGATTNTGKPVDNGLPKRPNNLGLTSIIAKKNAQKHNANEIDTKQDAPLLNKARATPKAIFIKEPKPSKAGQDEDPTAPLLIDGACAMDVLDSSDDGPDGMAPKERSPGPTVAFLVEGECSEEHSDDSGSIMIPPAPPGCCAWRGFDIAAVIGFVVVLSLGGVALALHLDGELESFLGIEDNTQLGSIPCNSNTGKSSVCSLNAMCVDSGATGENGRYPCECLPGYAGNGYRCDDIDECLLSSPNCTRNSNCDNTIGSYTCRCNAGFSHVDDACADIDECQGHFYCPAHSECVNTFGSYKCACQEGYHSDGGYCRDVNECQTGQHGCHANATCTNKMGSYACACKLGFFGNGTHCEVDDCYINNKYFCDGNAGCRMENKAIKCICKSGYTGNGETCRDVNECELPGFCDAHASCINTNGSYVCTCEKGFYGDGRKCTDFDECHLHMHTCSRNAMCKNTAGSYTCSCLSGYHGDECKDRDECEEGVHACSADGMCINTSGSYECVCNKGYQGNGTHCDCAEDGCGKHARCKGKGCSGGSSIAASGLAGLFVTGFVQLVISLR